MGALTVLQRRIVDLSGAAVQKPGLIIVEEADADLDDAAVQRLGLLCQRLVQASGETSLILVGQRVGLLVTAPVPEQESTEQESAEQESAGQRRRLSRRRQQESSADHRGEPCPSGRTSPPAEPPDEPPDRPADRRTEGAQA